MERPGDRTVGAALLGAIGAGPEQATLFVDFDGTIASIVEDPRAAVAVPGVTAALARLAARLGVVAVVSGRPAGFLLDRLGAAARLSGIRIFGLYGGEEVLADGSISCLASDDGHRGAFEETMVMARIAVPGARIEDKGTSVALHFRENPENEDALHAVALEAAPRFGLAVLPGRMVFELAAPAAPDKGTVVRRLLAGASAAVGFGDDVGDLAAFDAIDQAASGSGLAVVKIAVGGDEMPPPLRARADFVLGDPHAVAAVLTELADGVDRLEVSAQP